MSEVPHWYRVYAEDPVLRKEGAKFRFFVKDFTSAMVFLVGSELSVQRLNELLRDKTMNEYAGIFRFLRLWRGIEFLPVFWTAPRTCLDGVEHVIGTQGDLFVGIRVEHCPNADSVRLKCGVTNSWIDFKLDRTGCAYFAPCVITTSSDTAYTATVIDGRGQCVRATCSVLAVVVDEIIHRQLSGIFMRTWPSP